MDGLEINKNLSRLFKNSYIYKLDYPIEFMEDKEGEFVDIKELPKDQKISLILNSLQIGEIIKLIGNDTKKGFIIDSKTGEKVTTPDLEYIKVKQVGAILPGSKVFIKKNIASFSKYLAEHGREDV